jgi:hypothetical protein
VGLPATRKVALPSPRTLGSARMFCYSALEEVDDCMRAAAMRRPAGRMMENFSRPVPPAPFIAKKEPQKPAERAPEPKVHDALDLSAIAASIKWSKLGDVAASGDLGRLSGTKRDKIVAAAELPQVRKVAAELGLAPVRLVLGLMARFMTARDRHAARIARALLRGIKPSVLAQVAELLALVEHDDRAPPRRDA